ncbi:MAG: hydroxyacylglutathione hydrolase [Myxococcota bacterium]|nr:hydroxyacylglutathione hydrolase [Myxococcota bacterium]
MLEIVQIPVWQDNYAYLIRCPSSGVVALVDSPEAAPILQALKARGWTLDLILNTHHHPDHIGANLALKEATGCSILGPELDRKRIPGIDRGLQDGDALAVGEAKGQVLFVPGHTRGHIAFHFPDSKALFIGDTLFVAGCGRLFEGTPEQLWASFERVKALPPKTQLFCAHEYTLSNLRFALHVDPENLELAALQTQAKALREQGQPTVPSTLAQELATNPFLRADQPQLAAAVGLEGQPAHRVLGALRALKDRF